MSNVNETQRAEGELPPVKTNSEPKPPSDLSSMHAAAKSVAKRSVTSAKSRNSHSSKTSSRASTTSMRAEALAEAAMLKAKLKYLDIESEKKIELEKIQTLKQIDMAEAKLNAIMSIEEEELNTIDEIVPSESENKRQFVADYINRNNFTKHIPEEPLLEAYTASTNNKDKIESTTKTREGQNEQNPFKWNTSPEEFHPHQSVRQPHFQHYQQYQTYPTHNEPQTSELSSLAKCFAEQVNLSRIPPPEPTIFSGNPLHFPQWKAAFDTLIERKNIPYSERIYYLQKYLTGAAKEAVDGYFIINTADAYDQAKGVLERRFGDQFVIANAFRDKLDNYPKIAPRDGHTLRQFADLLRQCESAMTSIENLQVLDDCRENRKLLTKLPEWLTLRWARTVAEWKKNKKQFPPFSAFVQFMCIEADIACDPVTSLQAIKSVTKSQSSENQHVRNTQRRVGSATALSTELLPSTKSFAEETDKGTTSCMFCNKRGHHIDDCYSFVAQPLEDRKTFAKTKGLCFACMNQGHLSKSCQKKRTCKVCKKRHPTALHGDKPRNNITDQHTVLKSTENSHSEPTTSSCNGVSLLNDTSRNNKCSMILPVWISHQDRQDTEILVYALLDTQSDTTFILDNTLEKLGLSGTTVKLKLSTMTAQDQLIRSKRIDGLQVRGFNSASSIPLPRTYTRDIMPASKSHIPTPDVARQWPHLRSISEQIPPIQDADIGLLIGYNCPKALAPRDIIPPLDNEPFGQRTDLGWGIVGIVDYENDSDPIGTSHRILAYPVPSDLPNKCSENWTRSEVLLCTKTRVKEIISPKDITSMMEMDFNENSPDEMGLSIEDKQFLQIVENGIRLTADQHFEMPHPLKTPNVVLPNNKSMAISRLKHLKHRLCRDGTYRQHYMTFMSEIIDKGYAERVPESELESDTGSVWYIPHHGVYHPKKPGKLRVVFDCSAKYQGICINDYLLQGPDLTNALVGVLCRFRKERVALTCDIEKMFYQFQVPKHQRDYLRFLWWEDLESPPVEYRMTVHLFGAKSSPGCSNYGLKETANRNECKFGTKSADFVRRNFYVDDGLTSVPTEMEAIDLVKNTAALCKEAGLRLHKFVSNSPAVMDAIPIEDQAKGIQDRDLPHDRTSSVERALGVHWCIEKDSFLFRIQLKDQPLTRRGILSTVCSIYDPLGFVAPVVLVGRQILQDMCKDQLNWDSSLPDLLRSRWERWRSTLCELESLRVRRCLKPNFCQGSERLELHHFSDASTSGYGQCSYLRVVSDSHVHCSFLMGKARVAPIKTMTIPRLELTAAVVSVKVSSLLTKELELENISEFFWTDSKVILGYIASDTKRFHVYVANRVQKIRNHSNVDQWNYVPTNANPADDGSRGLMADEFITNSTWITGPTFLWKSEIDLPCVKKTDLQLDPTDKEVKTTFLTKIQEKSSDSFLEHLRRNSTWNRSKKVTAYCLRFMSNLKKRRPRNNTKHLDPLDVEELDLAESTIIRLVQQESFPEEIKFLKQAKSPSTQTNERHARSTKKKYLKGNSCLHRLDPYLDNDGILRVGGRLKLGDHGLAEQHPKILPRDNHVTTLIIRDSHEKVAHQGRGLTINKIRSNGFWILGATSVVSSYISKCVTCRHLRSTVQEQRMADLPAERLEPSAPFTHCGVDLFGPWIIKEGRKQLKRYGVLFTCLCSRAIHIETANSLETDAFINALRRFLTIRGPIRTLRCDRGTNFVGAENELKRSWEEMDHDRINKHLLEQNCDYFKFKMNAPSASHMGGIWERQIRSVRTVLGSLMKQVGNQLDDELLRTLMCEAAAIVNSRPLTVDTLNDPTSLKPLTPSQLLTLKSEVLLPPPGTFQHADLYARKRWKRVQHLANEFWSRWKREYVQNLTVRQKWSKPRRDMQIGDVVLIKDDNLPRNQWQLGRITETYKESDNHVRKVKLTVGNRHLTKQGLPLRPSVSLDRPIHKLILIFESQNKCQ